MDQLTAMRAFVETVKRRSLTNAAQSMNISRALVSRLVQGLEDHVGARLMHRTTRSIALTEAGEKYFHFCDAILAQIADMDQDIADEAGAAEGTLAILCPKWLGYHAVADAAAIFAGKHVTLKPKLSLGGMSPTAYDFLERGFDVALHTRPIPDSRIVAKRLTEIPLILAAAPVYVDQTDGLDSPESLSNKGGLIQIDHPNWHFERDGKTSRVSPQPLFSSNTYLALHRAALTGLGAAVLPRALVANDLDAGRLVQLFPDWKIEPQALYIALAPGAGNPQKVRIFVDFLAEHFRANPL